MRLALVLLLAVAEGEVAFRVGPTVRVSMPTLGRPTVEPHLSAHPTDPNRLLAGAMLVGNPQEPFETSRLQSFFSTDGGVSWRERGFPWYGYDPWTAVAADGRALLVWLGGTDPASEARPIRIFRSADGGASWSADVETLAGEFDGAKLALVEWGEPVILAATRFDHGDGEMRTQVAVYRVDWDRAPGSPAQPALLDNGPPTRVAAQPLALGRGRVLVAATSSAPGVGSSEVWVHRSTDGGRSFTEKSRVSSKLSPGLGYAQLVGGAATSSAGDQVVFVRALAPPHQPSGVWLNRSTDGGSTWSAEQRVDRFADGKSLAAQVPSAAIAADGTLGISWIDRRDDPQGRRNRPYFTWSRDGGQTFAAPVAVSDGAADPLTPENGASGSLLPGGGHYQGLSALANGDFQALWSDSREGVFALYTARLMRQPAPGPARSGR